jgi:hypothetical protein
MPGPSTTGIPASYLPAYKAGLTHAFKVTVTNAAQRLTTLINAVGTFPLYPDERYALGTPLQPILRAPFHCLLQVPAAAANPVYMTWDNNTAPVVGGPGLELEQGIIYKFENAGVNLLFSPVSATNNLYPFNANGAMQFIATANTAMLVTLSD